VAQLREQDAEDPGSLEELVGIYVRTSTPTVRALRERLDAGDLNEVARIAHKLKGGSAVMGAIRLSDLCQRVETRAEAGDNGLETLVAEISAEFDRAVIDLQELAAGNMPPPHAQIPPEAKGTEVDSAALPVIDPSIGEQLRALSSDDPARYSEFTRAFSGSMAERLARLQDALTASDVRTLTAMAEKVRNGSAFVGALRLSEACARLEAMPPGTPQDQLDSLVRAIVEEYSRLKGLLEGL